MKPEIIYKHPATLRQYLTSILLPLMVGVCINEILTFDDRFFWVIILLLFAGQGPDAAEFGLKLTLESEVLKLNSGLYGLSNNKIKRDEILEIYSRDISISNAGNCDQLLFALTV